MTTARRLVASLVAGTLAVVLAACGGADRTGSQTPIAEVGRPIATAEPTPGVVEVDGAPDGLTTLARATYARTHDDVIVEQGSGSEARAFERLCIGEIDVADTARSITPDELATCRDHGLEVVQLQVGAEALVLATGRQADLGVDCLSTDQVRATLQAGSSIDTWSDLVAGAAGPADVELVVGGPDVRLPDARFLGRTVLGRPRPADSDLRGDYVPSDDEASTLRFVAGADDATEVARRLRTLELVWSRLKARLQQEWAAWARTDDQVNAAVQRQRRGVGDAPGVRRAVAARSRQVARVDAARARYRPVDRAYRDLLSRQRGLDATIGRLGLFSHGFYAGHDDRLRAVEIEASGGAGDSDCVLATPATILDGSYPLARPLLLTVTTRALRRGEVQGFLSDYLAHAPAYAARAGVLPLPVADLGRQLSWIGEGATPPRFEIVDGELRETASDDTVTDGRAPEIPVR